MASPYLKQIERSATGAFCPHGPFLAAGTVAGAIDMSFSTNSVLEASVGLGEAAGRYHHCCAAAAAPISMQTLL